MKLFADKLAAHLQKTTAPVYLLYGDEPLQVMELGDRLRVHAKAQGFVERQVLQAPADDDWSHFREAADSLSLFAERRLVELRLPAGKPGRNGSEVLKQYCANPPADVLLLITCTQFDYKASSSAWFKAIDKVGVCIGVQAVERYRLPDWIQSRMQAVGLSASKEALELIADRVQGNMLAASQEVERLALLFPNSQIGEEQVLEAVADSSRYAIGDLLAAVLGGKASQALRVVKGLRDEAVQPVPVIWTLGKEVRKLARAAELVEHGKAADAALKQAGVFGRFAQLSRKALQRHTASEFLHLQSAASRLDRLSKGQGDEDLWDALETFSVQLAGRGLAQLPTDLSSRGLV